MGKWDTTFLLSKDFLPHFTRLAFGTPADPPKNRGGIYAQKWRSEQNNESQRRPFVVPISPAFQNLRCASFFLLSFLFNKLYEIIWPPIFFLFLMRVRVRCATQMSSCVRFTVIQILSKRNSSHDLFTLKKTEPPSSFR